MTCAASSAAAQGTITPSEPAPLPPAGTPSQPPPVAPAQPATAANPTALGAANEASTEPVAEPSERGAPKARTGFQMAIRSGVAIPLGELQKDSKMSDTLGLQVPVTIDIGGKIIPQLFLGGYVGFSGGGGGETCDKNNVSCTALGFRIGAQIQYHILPDARLNPWIGYGIGYDAIAIAGSSGNNRTSMGAGGVEFAHLMAGLDFRLTRGLGIGPFADFAIGQYSKTSTETTVNEVSVLKTDGDIQNTALHEWLTLGVKFTIFP